MMKARFLILPALILAQTAAADTVKLLPGPFELPDRIGPMRLNGEPHRYDDPRLGSSYQYSGGGLSLTSYVYNLGVTNIPDGGDTRLACEAFEGAKGDVQHAGYANVQLKSEQLARLDPAADSPTAREAVYEYTRANQASVSYIWLTGAANLFVKMRFSVDKTLRDELPEARRAILTALGEAIKPHLAPVDSESKEGNAEINVSANDADEMASALAYLVWLSAAGEENPELLPVCGGPLVPDFATEVDAMKGLLTTAAESGQRSKFTRHLSDIDRAGFLDEFVWEYRHQPVWGDRPPRGLKIAAFDRWRKKNLKDLQVPVFGNVDYAAPRPLPRETAEASPAR
jgi:hypothetical protein